MKRKFKEQHLFERVKLYNHIFGAVVFIYLYIYYIFQPSS